RQLTVHEVMRPRDPGKRDRHRRQTKKSEWLGTESHAAKVHPRILGAFCAQGYDVVCKRRITVAGRRWSDQTRASDFCGRRDRPEPTSRRMSACRCSEAHLDPRAALTHT